MYRIVFYLDNPPGRAAYLRESSFDYTPGEREPFVVVAKEYDAAGVCTRTWWLCISPVRVYDGLTPFGEATPPEHRIVDPNIVPGEESKAANPMTRMSCPNLNQILHQLKQNQNKDILAIKAKERFCKTYHDAIRRGDEIERQLTATRAELTKADARNREFAERAAILDNELRRTQSELEAFRQEKTLTHRVREWGRGWYRKRG